MRFLSVTASKSLRFLVARMLIGTALIALQSLTQSTYEPYTFTTLAGSAGQLGSADGKGGAARFFYPAGVAVDSAGNIYVADELNHTIRKGFPAAMILSSEPGFGFSGGQFGFSLTGPMGHSVVVEASIDLMNWLPLWTNTFGGDKNFIDSQSGVYSNRFYRARLP